jgi:cytoplasmic iron level regulating protein YaaA (DUF328/UPF0246 family)
MIIDIFNLTCIESIDKITPLSSKDVSDIINNINFLTEFHSERNAYNIVEYKGDIYLYWKSEESSNQSLIYLYDKQEVVSMGGWKDLLGLMEQYERDLKLNNLLK